MKKYLGIIIGMGFLFSSLTPLHVQAQSLNDQQLAIVATALANSGDYSTEQIVEIMIALSSLSPASSSNQSDVIIAANEVCAFRYNGDDSITAIQQELQNQGYTITKVDGKIGPETRAAVTALQTDNNAVKIDGLIGDETRSILMKNSIACLGDDRVILSNTTVTMDTNNLCQFNYNGDDSITAIQQELQNQGYTITKVDGKIGPETRAAVTALQTDNNAVKIDGLIGDETRILLAKNSVRCEINSTSTATQSENVDTDTDTEMIETVENTVEPTPQEPAIENTTNTNTDTGADNFIIKDEILAAVRSTGLITDDTAVFTYRLTLNPDTPISVSTNSNIAFAINIYDGQGNLVNADQATSIVSNAEKIVRADRTSDYLITTGDTVSLRSTSQPGPGVYYAELGRFTYAGSGTENSINPSLVNYGLQDSTNWRSGTVTLEN